MQTKAEKSNKMLQNKSFDPPPPLCKMHMNFDKIAQDGIFMWRKDQDFLQFTSCTKCIK